jgi:hypothetical protein
MLGLFILALACLVKSAVGIVPISSWVCAKVAVILWDACGTLHLN